MGTWTYAYDTVGNLTRQTDAKNQRTCFYYDGHNRLKGKTYSTGTATCPADPGYGSYTVKNYYDDTTYTYTEGGAAITNRGLGRRTENGRPLRQHPMGLRWARPAAQGNPDDHRRRDICDAVELWRAG